METKPPMSKDMTDLLRQFHSGAMEHTDTEMEINFLDAKLGHLRSRLLDVGLTVESGMTVGEFRLIIGGYKLRGCKEKLHQKIYQFFPKKSSRYWMIHCEYNPRHAAAQFATWMSTLISVEVCNEHPYCALLYGDSYNIGNQAADSGRAMLDTLRELEGGAF